MSMSPISRSHILAVINAKQAVTVGVGIDERQTRQLLSVIEMMDGMLRSRVQHIGVVNAFLHELIEEGHIEMLPDVQAATVVDLLHSGIRHAAYDFDAG